MERIRNLTGRKQSYERLSEDADDGYGTGETRPLTLGEDEDEEGREEGTYEAREMTEEPFEWLIYGVFFLLGVAMLWAW